jgi:ADP-ribosyl-[dinitrogen reductase] hydrolase
MQMQGVDGILGCIFGGAIGDAMGVPYEGSVPPVAIDDLAVWRLSDDTQLTLATCEAIAKAGRVDPEAIAAGMAAWFAEGRVTGVGATTCGALRALTQGGHWALAGMRGERAAGNGAAMRIAPLAFFLDPADRADRQVIRDVCRITHHNDEAYVGALAVMAAVRAAWVGTWSGQPDLIARIVNLLPDSRVRDRLSEIMRIDSATGLLTLVRRFGNTGYAVESVPLALYGAQRVRATGFQGMLEEVVSAGGDTDSIASMAGQVAGTLLGCKALPAWMVVRLPDRDMVQAIAGQFSRGVPAGTGHSPVVAGACSAIYNGDSSGGKQGS